MIKPGDFAPAATYIAAGVFSALAFFSEKPTANLAADNQLLRRVTHPFTQATPITDATQRACV